MFRPSILLLLLVTCTGTAFAQRPGSYGATNPPPAPGAPRFVQIESVDGLPRGAEERAEVLGALRGAFALDAFAVETRAGAFDAWRADGEWPNRFRLLEGSPADSVWTLRVVMGFPRELPKDKLQPRPTVPGTPATARRAGARAAHGFTMVVSVTSPEARFRAAVPDERRFSVVLPADTSRVYAWDVAGDAAGRLALETLHRAAGDLRDAQRARLVPARRAGE